MAACELEVIHSDIVDLGLQRCRDAIVYELYCLQDGQPFLSRDL